MEKIARIIISFVILGVALAGTVFWVWPRYQELSSLRMQLQAKRERVEQGEVALAKLRALEARVQEHAEDFAKISEAVPQDGALPALYDHIEELGASSGLLLGSIQGAEQKKEGQTISTITIRASFTGSYEAFKQFLRVAQRSARFLNVRSLTITSSAEDPDAFSFTFELVAYAKP